MVKQCIRCRKEINEGDYFCPYCGEINAVSYNKSKRCLICGSDISSGEMCERCNEKVELNGKIRKLLRYVKPGDEIKERRLIKEGYESLELNELIIEMLEEGLLFTDAEKIKVAGSKRLNDFIKVYGTEKDLIKESKNETVEQNIDLKEYSDYVRIFFNQRNNKWEINLLDNNKPILTKFLPTLEEANEKGIKYLKDIGKLEKKSSRGIQRKYSKRDGIFFSEARNMWGARVKGIKGSRILGYYNSEREAVQAKREYMNNKTDRTDILYGKTKVKNEIYVRFSKRANQWSVSIPRKRGGFKVIDYFDSEEEALKAKEEYLKSKEEE